MNITTLLLSTENRTQDPIQFYGKTVISNITNYLLTQISRGILTSGNEIFPTLQKSINEFVNLGIQHWFYHNQCNSTLDFDLYKCYYAKQVPIAK